VELPVHKADPQPVLSTGRRSAAWGATGDGEAVKVSWRLDTALDLIAGGDRQEPEKAPNTAVRGDSRVGRYRGVCRTEPGFCAGLMRAETVPG
jgi:hypothetical protein